MTKTIEELRSGITHLAYEIDMFRALSLKEAMEQFAPKSPDWDRITKNMLTESWTIHLRTLTDFFFPTENPDRDDITARDFIEGWEYRRGNRPEALGTASVKVNKQCVHITWTRNSYTVETKGWQVREMIEELEPIVDSFIARLDPELSKQLIAHWSWYSASDA